MDDLESASIKMMDLKNSILIDLNYRLSIPEEKFTPPQVLSALSIVLVTVALQCGLKENEILQSMNDTIKQLCELADKIRNTPQ